MSSEKPRPTQGRTQDPPHPLPRGEVGATTLALIELEAQEAQEAADATWRLARPRPYHPPEVREHLAAAAQHLEDAARAYRAHLVTLRHRHPAAAAAVGHPHRRVDR